MYETVSVTGIPRYRSHVRGPKPVTEPMSKLLDASRKSKRKLDGDSRAFCSDNFPFGPLDRLADYGIVPLRAKVRNI